MRATVQRIAWPPLARIVPPRIDSAGIPTMTTTSFASRTVLVTGATGFVGTRLVSRLLDLGANVVCFVRDDDPASALHRSDAIDRVSIINGRLETFEHVKTAIVEREPDVIVHLGAQAIVKAGRIDPLGTFESNIRGTYHVLEACRLYGSSVKSLVIASSDKAYGECETLPYTEDTPLAARNPYDVSKSCADLLAQSYAATYNLPIAIARCGNIFGPGDLHWSRLVPGTIRSLLRGESPMIRSDGTLVRDYLYVEDAVDAYIALATWAEVAVPSDHPHRAFNFSGDNALSVMEMTALIQRACNRQDLEPTILDQAQGEISEQELDWSRARTTLKWQPRHELVVALHDTVLWYKRYLKQEHVASVPARARRARASA